MKMTLRLTKNPQVAAKLDKLYVCLEMPKIYETEAEAISKLDEGYYSVEIKKHTGKKTKSQNAYIWELITEIGKAMRMSPTEAYRTLVRDSSNYVIGAYRVEQFKSYKRTWESNGKGWIVEILSERGEWIEAISYYGMSAWSKEQASLFIDMLIAECEELNIPIERIS